MSAKMCGCDPDLKTGPYYCRQHGAQETQFDGFDDVDTVKPSHQTGRLWDAYESLGHSVCHRCGRVDGQHGEACAETTKATGWPEGEGAPTPYPPTFAETPLPEAPPHDSESRKLYPVGTGVLDYFPDALLAIARVSHEGNAQHNPGQPLHWSRGKSDDHADALIRHFLDRGFADDDGQPHSAKMAWRALAILQLEEEERLYQDLR